MMSFRGQLNDLAVPASTAWLLAEIAEAKGRQELYARQSPQVLKALRDAALVQSVESSNRIEGVEVPQDRLRPLVLGNARPRDRSEVEIHGYRQALNLVHANAASLPITPRLIRQLHATIVADSGDAGRWKKADNEIVELRPGAPPTIRFRPLSASRTPEAMEQLCVGYRHALLQTRLPPLLADALFLLDFLCIHPFRDGNGRVSRLLALLALYQHGYEVGRYVSLERLTEEARDDYYETLRTSSLGWHDGRHDWRPWVNFHLGIIHRAYRLFEERAGQVKAQRGAKRALVEAAIGQASGPFTLADIERRCPGVSRDMVRLVLREMARAGRVRCLGRGPGARWQKSG